MSQILQTAFEKSREHHVPNFADSTQNCVSIHKKQPALCASFCESVLVEGLILYMYILASSLMAGNF